MPNADIARGANYIPGTAHIRGNVELFLVLNGRKKFVLDDVRAEAAFLSSLSCKHVRLFQSFWTYMTHRAEHVENLGKVAAILKEYGIGILLTLNEGVVAYGSWVQGADSQRNSPWYDLYGAGGSQRWDPTAQSNPGLMNGTNGLMDPWLDLQKSQWEAQLVAHRGHVGGGAWFPCPDPLYMTTFDMRAYPLLGPTGHEDFWQAIKDYIDDTIQAVKDNGILDAVDLINEPEICIGVPEAVIFDLDSLSQPNNPILYAEFIGNFAYYPPDPLHLLQMYARYAAHIVWLMECVNDLHPDVLTTVGHVKPSDIIPLFGDPPNLSLDPPDFLSAHNYGFGWLTEHEYEDQATIFASHSKLAGKKFVMNEFYRMDVGGDRALLPVLHYIAKHGVGGYMWDIFETPTFSGTDGTYTNPINGATAPPNLAFPVTGQARSVVIEGTHHIIRRREDMYPYMREWFEGEEQQLDPGPPTHYGVEKVGYKLFALKEITTGELLRPGPNTRIVWRWAVVDDSDINDRDPKSWNWITDTWHSWYFVIGKLLDAPDEMIIEGSPYLDLSSFDYATIGGGQSLIVHAAWGNRAFELEDHFDELVWNDTLPNWFNQTEFLAGDPPDADVRVQIHDALIAAAREHQFRMISYNADGHMVLGSIVSPRTVLAQDTSASFGLPERARREDGVDRTSWTWQLRLQFDREITPQSFEEFRGPGSRILIPKTTTTRQVTLRLVDAQYSHPVKRDPSSGSSVVYTYNAVLAPVC